MSEGQTENRGLCSVGRLFPYMQRPCAPSPALSVKLSTNMVCTILAVYRWCFTDVTSILIYFLL